jgi:hypothetical protein
MTHSVDIERPKTMLMLGAVLFFCQGCLDTEPQNWKIIENQLVSESINASGTRTSSGMRVGCRGSRLNLEVVWGVPLKNIYPRSSVPAAAKAYATFGTGRVWETGWTPYKNGLITRPPNIQNTVASGVDSLIFSMLGMDSISEENAEMFNWTASEFVNKIANHAAMQGDEKYLKLTSTTVDNDQVNLTFDLRGFNEMANQHLNGRCI